MERSECALLLVAISLFCVAGCAPSEDYPPSIWNAQHPPADASVSGSDDGGELGTVTVSCSQARAEPLPARLVAISSTSTAASSGPPPVVVSDIFNEFVSVCGTCHGPSVDPPGQGGFQIQRDADFPSLMTRAVLNHVEKSVCPNSPNAAAPDDPMPPCSSPNGGTYAKRSATDPIKQFSVLVDEWLSAGSPRTFVPGGASAPPVDAGAVRQYAMTPATGNAMTNVGNCVPDRLAFDAQDEALDAMFASAKTQSSGSASQRLGLPERLNQTDMISLDSKVLAQHGVVAYAPGYPLWSDNAGKLRHVRVPHGTSIHFDKTTQQFTIPPNTRFYKTFMKQIIDTDNSYRYRKIETRLIVSRPDIDNADGTVTQTALFGTYRWTDDESDALLIQTPLNNGTPFADTYITYNVDELLAADILRSGPSDPEEALLENHAVRHYAIPSSQRCVQCHMGSPSHAFVLGFTPLQINRRPVGTGGVIEATGPDELTQLQRFIDAGIVTGISSLSDVLPLEQSEGTRTPRPATGVITATGLPDNYELVAQGYMLGNCQHCHNPRGFPTVQNPVLKGVLNFLPSTDGGGIFQFPLESYSPRIGRGPSGSTPIPYITPSLVDLPRSAPATGYPAADAFVSGGPKVTAAAYAPWRSLLYRNVDSAFAYTDDLALFPHMPMNTPGYDPRAKQIMSDWMVSIPSVRKHPEVVEYAYQTKTFLNPPGTNWPLNSFIGDSVVDTEPQPYVEVTPDLPEYPAAVLAAQQRLAVLHSGNNTNLPLAAGVKVYSRYLDPGQTDDIQDPLVRINPICQPIPTGAGAAPYPFPTHPHWVITDLTLPPPPWAPHRPDWQEILVKNSVPAGQSTCGAAGAQDAHDDEVRAVAALQTAKLSDVAKYVTTPVPFGLWQQKPGCNFSSQKTAQDFSGTTRPHWLDVANPPPDAPVYQEPPGAGVYKMICINCHGPTADSHGRMADNLATMTGGLAVPADFRNGLFGPPGTTGNETNLHAQFAVPANANWPANWAGANITDDDRAARYMPWMALGGTEVQIPLPILQIVAVTSVLGEQRVLRASQLSANMLSQAKSLCLTLLGPTQADHDNGETFDPTPGHGYLDAKKTFLNDSLIASNYDAELWMNLCALSNPPPIHILKPDGTRKAFVAPAMYGSDYSLAVATGGLVAPSVYPPTELVGNERAGVQYPNDPSQPLNLWPWCADLSLATPADTQWVTDNGYPACPASVEAVVVSCRADPSAATCYGNEAASTWAVRGAINAGMAVYAYVKSIEGPGPAPDYNQCELLK